VTRHTGYARVDGLNIALQTYGEGPRHLIFVPGYMTKRRPELRVAGLPDWYTPTTRIGASQLELSTLRLVEGREQDREARRRGGQPQRTSPGFTFIGLRADVLVYSSPVNTRQ
jgi:hypothetical protein